MREATQQRPIAYRGQRTSRGAIVEAQMSSDTWRPLDPRLDLRTHSPTGFEWGYGGSGPAQLALVLAASRLPETLALTVYQRLKQALVARLDDVWYLLIQSPRRVARRAPFGRHRGPNPSVLSACLARRPPAHDRAPPFVVQVAYNPPFFRALVRTWKLP
ncbi:MAG TPA: DUF6166 domain-containing protein [Thermoanaerobaculia bacterium]|nr:DUF6166 domain-containing protein [Thermoanaerobaculia bacterium]